MRVGIGYDIHRLKTGRKLILGGMEVSCNKGLTGHSDADVVIHAIIDALLGASGNRDIGYHFPPGDSHYKDIASTELLKLTVEIVSQRKLYIENIDVTIIAEEPVLSPYIDPMRSRLSRVCGLTADRVTIKAKTNEGLGDIGRKKAIAAFAVVLLNELSEVK